MVLKAGGRLFQFQRGDGLEEKSPEVGLQGRDVCLWQQLGNAFQPTEENVWQGLCVGTEGMFHFRTSALKTQSGHSRLQLEERRHHPLPAPGLLGGGYPSLYLSRSSSWHDCPPGESLWSKNLEYTSVSSHPSCKSANTSAFINQMKLHFLNALLPEGEEDFCSTLLPTPSVTFECHSTGGLIHLLYSGKYSSSSI